MLVYVDDFIVIAPGDIRAQVVQFLEDMCEDMGTPVSAPKKSEEDKWPASTTKWCGWIHDAARRVHELPQDKHEKYHREIHEWSKMKVGRRVSVAKLQQLVGRLMHVARVVTPGRAFLRGLVDIMSKSVPRWSRAAAQNIDWWGQWFATEQRFCHMRRPWVDTVKYVFTDASTTGFVGVGVPIRV